MNLDKNVAKITLTFDDGTSEDLEKAFCGRFKKCGDVAGVTFDMVGVEGEDLYLIVSSVAELAARLGMFDN